jgi:hypothetical protein
MEIRVIRLIKPIGLCLISLYIFIYKAWLHLMYKSKINYIKSFKVSNLVFNEYFVNQSNNSLFPMDRGCDKYVILYILDETNIEKVSNFSFKKITHACILDIDNDEYILDITKYLKHFIYHYHKNSKVKWSHVLDYVINISHIKKESFTDLYIYINTENNEIKHKIGDIINESFGFEC